MSNETIENNQTYYATTELSIRRKGVQGLPGDDASLHNRKVGAAMTAGGAPLSGLSFNEEKLYLADIIGISPQDHAFRQACKDYWSNISTAIPADGTTVEKLQGKILKFTIEFKSKSDRDAYEKVLGFEAKAEASLKGEVIDGVANYVLFRYCLKYSRVANRVEDIGKSAKIFFYLYSKEHETRVEHAAFKARTKAQTLFTQNLMKEDVLDAVLLLFDQNLASYEGLADKHLALEALIKVQPAKFVKFIEDSNLEVKAFIRKAVDHNILRRPANTDSYYFGENSEVCLGTTLMDAVLYWKSDTQSNVQIVESIKARLKNL